MSTNVAPSIGTSVVSPTFGLIVGSAKNFVDLDISAYESMGEVKVLSARSRHLRRHRCLHHPGV